MKSKLIKRAPFVLRPKINHNDSRTPQYVKDIDSSISFLSDLMGWIITGKTNGLLTGYCIILSDKQTLTISSDSEHLKNILKTTFDRVKFYDIDKIIDSTPEGEYVIPQTRQFSDLIVYVYSQLITKLIEACSKDANLRHKYVPYLFQYKDLTIDTERREICWKQCICQEITKGGKPTQSVELLVKLITTAPAYRINYKTAFRIARRRPHIRDNGPVPRDSTIDNLVKNTNSLLKKLGVPQSEIYVHRDNKNITFGVKD